MIKILVSACLLGENVRYNGASAPAHHDVLARWLDEGRVVRFCPEVAGGLGVPRPAAEIESADGAAVLDGLTRVVTREQADVTGHFVRGTHLALDAARGNGVRLAILKDGSPSCGTTAIYDGTFSGVTRRGPGVTAALLERHGIRVFSERQIEAAAAHLAEIGG